MPNSNTAFQTFVNTLPPPFDVGGVLAALNRYPFGCVEQLVSRALPLLGVLLWESNIDKGSTLALKANELVIDLTAYLKDKR